MKIFTFHNTDEDAPASQRAVARIWADMPGRGGGTVQEFHSVIFMARSEEEARTKATEWWAAELARFAAKAKPRAKAKAMEAAPGTPEVEEEEAIG